MAASGSSVSPSESNAGLALLLSLFAAACLAGQMTLFMLRIVDSGVVLGTCVGLVLAAFLGVLATNNDQDSRRTTVGLTLGLAIPAVLYVLGFGGFAYGWLFIGGIATTLTIPLVQWMCDTQPPPKNLRPGQKMVKSHPIPGAIVAGILLFALPGASFWNYLLAAGYFGFLLMIASLGHLMERGREIGGSVVVDPLAMARWLPVALMLLLACGLAGVGIPAASQLHERQMQQAQGTGLHPIPDRPGGTMGDLPWQRGQDGQPTKPNPEAQQNQPLPQPGKGDQSGRPQPPPPPPPEQPIDFRDLAIKALILLVAAAILFWVVRRYGQRIMAFFDRVWKKATAPFVRWLDERREQTRLNAYEAMLRAEMQRQGDPFAPLPETPTVEELPIVYRSFLANAWLLGAEPTNSETVGQFVNRLGDVHRLDRRLLATVGQVCSRGVFAPNPPTESERRAASEAATTLARKIQSQISEQTLAAKKTEYRRLLAIRALKS